MRSGRDPGYPACDAAIRTGILRRNAGVLAGVSSKNAGTNSGIAGGVPWVPPAPHYTNRPQSLKLEILAVASEIGPAPALTDMANGLRHSGSPMRRRRPAKRGSEWRLSRRESVVR